MNSPAARCPAGAGGGLHQAIEAKEGVAVQQETVTLATITFQNFFRLYDKLAGMTGTAITEAEEFHTIYTLEVVPIPTHRPMIRLDEPDLIYKTEEGKYRAVVEEIADRNKKGQPILVGTTSIEKSERLSRALDKTGVQHRSSTRSCTRRRRTSSPMPASAAASLSQRTWQGAAPISYSARAWRTSAVSTLSGPSATSCGASTTSCAAAADARATPASSTLLPIVRGRPDARLRR